MNREEHVEWSKKRALKYVDRNELTDAYASMTSDLTNHDETTKHPGIGLGMGLMIIGKLNTMDEMRKFINGFN